MFRFTGNLLVVTMLLTTAVQAQQHSTNAYKAPPVNRDANIPAQVNNPPGWRQFVPGLALAPGFGLMPFLQQLGPAAQGGPGGRPPPGSRSASGSMQGQVDPRTGYLPQGTPQIH
jgi:hypothetical protein